ncbi:MAG: GNAT family N-acetyltransferase [Actinomycetes bacterium]
MPWPVEQPVLSDRVVSLRAVRGVDAAAIYEACQDPDIQHFTQVPVPYQRSDAETFTALCSQWWRERMTANFAVCSATAGAFLGVLGVIGADHRTHTAGFGYWTAPWGRGQGATIRAAKLASHWALTIGGIRTLTAEAELSNPASMQVLANVGFTRAEGEDLTMELKGTLRTFSVWRMTAG